MNNSLSEEIEKARKLKGWTRAQLAAAAKLPLGEIELAESGDQTSSTNLELICKALGILGQLERHTRGRLPDKARSPYKGLGGFGEADASLFFGRDRFVDRIMLRLGNSPIVGVIGPSGSGKSSIVKAGVLPKLRARHRLHVCQIRPGRRPMAALAVGLADYMFGNEERIKGLQQLKSTIETDPALLVQDLRMRSSNGLFVLLIDQFEELFVQTGTVNERKLFLDFLDELASAEGEDDCRTRIIFSVRNDFYRQLMGDSKFAELIQDRLVPLTQMNDEELREAIVRPAESLGRKIESELVEQIIKDAGDQPGNMPLVSFCLDELWEEVPSQSLTLSAYDKIGGLRGSIASQAEKVFQSLDDRQKSAARRLLSRMVSIEDDQLSGVAATRRTLRYDSVANDDQEAKVAEKLVSSRLAITDYSNAEDGQTIELAHEAVIQNWERLNSWLLEDRAFLIWQQRVESDANAWEVKGRPKSGVLRGALLAEGQKWMNEGRADDMKPLVRALFDASQLTFKEESDARYEGLLRALLGAEPDKVLSIIADIHAAFSTPPKDVATRFLNENASDRGAWKLRLLVASSDTSQVEHIVAHLKSCEPSDLMPIVASMKGVQEIVESPLRDLLARPDIASSSRLRIACALASLCIEPAVWNPVADQIVQSLISENPLHLLTFSQCLLPVAELLFEPLGKIVASTVYSNAVRDSATLVLIEFAGTDPQKFIAILNDCTDDVFQFAFDAAIQRSDANALVQHLSDAITSGALVNKSPAETLRSGRQAASAAIALCKLGRVKDALRVLTDRASPDRCSQFAFRASKLRVDAGRLVEELVRADEPDEIYWLTLAVGEFQKGTISPVALNALVHRTRERYSEHPSALVHSASAWLLRALGKESLVKEADHRLSEASFFGSSRNWCHMVGPAGPLCFVKVPSGTVSMGAPNDEPGYKKYEGPIHERQIGTGLWACVREVTVAEYAGFVEATGSPPLQNIGEFSPDGDHPAIALTWTEAKSFCKWLEQWLRDVSGVQCDVGLPTEAEWEHCARAGTSTPFSFGSDMSLLEKFAWYENNSGFKTHPAGVLRPNQFGLFNMHGNCWEWCEDIYRLYDGSEAIPFGADSDDVAKALRTLRGGCWNLHWRYSRSACRNWHAPTNRNYYTGVRVYIRETPGEKA